MTTRRVAVLVDGGLWDEWTEVEIARDLTDLAGSFSLTGRDAPRDLASWPYASAAAGGPLTPGRRVTITIDGEVVLIGHIETAEPEAEDGAATIRISGRDVTGDLVDSAAAPEGPSEYKGIKLDEYARKILKPFGLALTVDTDVGAPIPRAAIDAGETALSAIEKYARRRAVLVTSDGTQGLVLTRAGTGRAPGALEFPGNVLRSSGSFSTKGRFSDTFVKGQAERVAGARREQARLDARARPTGTPPPARSEPFHEAAGILPMGRAQDPAIERWRPRVIMARTGAGEPDAQTNADWKSETSQAEGDTITHLYPDWRINGRLWKPNELVAVADRYQLWLGDMLIAGVTFRYSEGDGHRTELRLVRPETLGGGA